MLNKSEWQEFIKIKPEQRGQYIKVTNFPKAGGGYLVGVKSEDFQTIGQHFKFWKYL